jgi:murein DD-endopeptidase MepM/ murein hydrolase activator NlpD
VLFVAATFLPATTAGAQTTQERLDRALDRAEDLRKETERVAAAFSRAQHDLDETTAQVAATTAAVDQAKAEMMELKAQVKDRVRAAYRAGGMQFFDVVLGARSFREFSLRMRTLEKQAEVDEELLLKLGRTRNELESRAAELDEQQETLESRSASYQQGARRLTTALEEAKQLAAQLRDQVSRERLAELFTARTSTEGASHATGPTASGRPPGATPSTPQPVSTPRRGGGGLDACPVDPPRVVTNSYGAPRDGGRSHEGNDIMAPKGTAIRAVKAGTIRSTGSTPVAGISFYLWDGSTEYYYAHLDSISVSDGQQVSAGQVVGANGNTGNASGGADHLHFEIHPGGGDSIDPYPALSAAC